VQVQADIYMHNPRGSNNKLSEESDNTRNQQRLFDSQDNAAAGYQVGDRCARACDDDPDDKRQNYNPMVPGAMKGQMKYYQGSELYIEWNVQHGCGSELDEEQPNMECQVIIQYMCDADNGGATGGIRDGFKRGNRNRACQDENNNNNNRNPPKRENCIKTELDGEDNTVFSYGEHEPYEYYMDCWKRERNKGLFTAGQRMQDRTRNNRGLGAASTRQANNGQRHGLECPEERDYYPYWHPTPWHDIVIFSSEANKVNAQGHTRCSYYQMESENVKGRHYCSSTQDQGNIWIRERAEDDLCMYNNSMDACETAGCNWVYKRSHSELFGSEEKAPECYGARYSRDNHVGNGYNGESAHYVWKIPEHVEGTCVLRIRYNITTGDMRVKNALGVPQDSFHFLDHEFNGDKAPMENDLIHDPVGLGSPLKINFNTDQGGRTFQDRSHTFRVEKRPADIPNSSRIVNYNVRGRRGNIVEVFPAVEYDFVPPNLHVEKGDYIHFQWVGSDAQQNNGGANGRDRTDRSNLVQLKNNDISLNMPAPYNESYLLCRPDGSGKLTIQDCKRRIERFSYLDQTECDLEEKNDDDGNNCALLNSASAYFNSEPIEMETSGTFAIASTRNNDFSNRSQKQRIFVLERMLWNLDGAVIVWIFVGSLFSVIILLLTILLCYQIRNPGSRLSAKRYRSDKVLKKCMRGEAKFEEWRCQRKKLKNANLEKWHHDTLLEKSHSLEEKARIDMMKPKHSKMKKFCPKFDCLKGYYLSNTQLFYLSTWIAMGAWGFLYNIGKGYKGSWYFCWAKTGGYILDLNLALLLLPTFRNIQTSLRQSTLKKYFCPEDPFGWHRTFALYGLGLGVGLHIFGHICHTTEISGGPEYWFTLLHYRLPRTHWQRWSGMPFWKIWLMWPLSSPWTGVILSVHFLFIFICSNGKVRRSTRIFDGYRLFWSLHGMKSIVVFYTLVIIHAPRKVIPWLSFPAILFIVEKMLEGRAKHSYMVLTQAELVGRDILKLNFEVPKGFIYEAGHYARIVWSGEKHPFTICSAPEEHWLTFSIKAPEQFDWCCALRERLINYSLKLKNNGIELDKRSIKPGTIVKFTSAMTSKGIVYSRPLDDDGKNVLEDVEARKEWITRTQSKMEEKIKSRSSTKTLLQGIKDVVKPNGEDWLFIGDRGNQDHEEKLAGIRRDSLKTEMLKEVPPEGTVLRMMGPYGAPAQSMWHFKTVMLVGTGIGVTPFAAMLRSVNIRLDQRKKVAKVLSNKKEKLGNYEEKEGLQNLVINATRCPESIYFYWCVRNNTDFNWFFDLLQDAISGSSKKIVKISLFMTGETDLNDPRVKNLTKQFRVFSGRPNWKRIFQEVKDENRGGNIGVFLCGGGARALSSNSEKFTDSETKFTFFAEKF